MGDKLQTMSDALALALQRHVPALSGCTVHSLTRLSGGANMETWSFDIHAESEERQLILRRSPLREVDQEAEKSPGILGGMSLSTEASLVILAQEHGVDVPTVTHVLTLGDQLGNGYIMSRERGEALPFKLLAEERYANAREGLAHACGVAMAKIHNIPLEEVPAEIRQLSTPQQLQRQQELLDHFGNVSAVHQLALNWLRDNQPDDGRLALLHGDFRNGNILVDENGLVAVLDWELAHVGHPAEDLGYICGNVWRFGRVDKPVGGFGQYEDLLAGYKSVAGWAPSLVELQYWEVYCALSWGLVCLTMLGMYRSGADQSLERAAVGRRMSESEIDLLLLLDGKLSQSQTRAPDGKKP